MVEQENKILCRFFLESVSTFLNGELYSYFMHFDCLGYEFESHLWLNYFNRKKKDKEYSLDDFIKNIKE